MKKIYWIAMLVTGGEIRVELFGTEEAFNQRIDRLIQDRGSEEVRWMLNDLDSNTYAAAWEKFCEEMKQVNETFLSGVQDVELGGVVIPHNQFLALKQNLREIREQTSEQSGRIARVMGEITDWETGGGTQPTFKDQR